MHEVCTLTLSIKKRKKKRGNNVPKCTVNWVFSHGLSFLHWNMKQPVCWSNVKENSDRHEQCESYLFKDSKLMERYLCRENFYFPAIFLSLSILKFFHSQYLSLIFISSLPRHLPCLLPVSFPGADWCYPGSQFIFC